MQEKIIEIVAGPNGSGKTTFAESYFEKTEGESVFLNPDVIAHPWRLCPYGKHAVQEHPLHIEPTRKHPNGVTTRRNDALGIL